MRPTCVIFLKSSSLVHLVYHYHSQSIMTRTDHSSQGLPNTARNCISVNVTDIEWISREATSDHWRVLTLRSIETPRSFHFRNFFQPQPGVSEIDFLCHCRKILDFFPQDLTGLCTEQINYIVPNLFMKTYMGYILIKRDLNFILRICKPLECKLTCKTIFVSGHFHIPRSRNRTKGKGNTIVIRRFERWLQL